MLTAKVAIRGIRPLLWHSFSKDTIPLEKQEKGGVAGNNPDEWRSTYLATEDGQLYLQPTYVFGTFRDGAKYTKTGLQKKVAATLQVLDDRVLVDRFVPDGDLPVDPAADVYIDIRGVVNPETHRRNVRYRIAASPGWKVKFGIIWDETIVDRKLMHSVAIDAGRFVGLGDGRNVGFGRFEVEKFTVEKPKVTRRKKRA